VLGYDMNKKLEDTFDLPSMEEVLKNSKSEESNSENKKENIEKTEEVVIEEVKIKKALSTAEKIDRALPQVKDLESHDIDMDEYSTEAMKSYKELMDLGMNSEARHAGKMFEVAATMLKNAVESKNAKADKKLRMIELQLKKQRVDQWDKRDDKQDEVIEGEGYVVGDRNKLLDQLIQKVNENDDKSNKEDK
tara:strand:- start:7464 stop:8039 length:576 start_codon:yes stop_codon:yes gene_type:complete